MNNNIENIQEVNHIYRIHESNFERFEKKIQRIQNKCTKAGLNFIYRVEDEIFDKDDDDNISKYYLVYVEGKIQYNGWSFVATLDHRASGNIIRKYDTELDVPEKYITAQCICDHCQTKRSRKATYIIYNEEQNEFKQVGRNCLAEFTSGLDGEQVAQYIEWLDNFTDFEAPGQGHTFYYDVKEVLGYAYECTRCFGYIKVNYDDPSVYSTKEMVSDLIGRHSLSGWCGEKAEERNFRNDPLNEDIQSHVTEAIEWINSQDSSFDYYNNLKVLIEEEYIKYKDFGIVCSLFAAYNRELAKKEAEAARQKEIDECPSSYQGEVGQRLDIEAVSFKCVGGFETLYGYTSIIEIKDEIGNVYIWFSSSYINDEAFSDDMKKVTLKGTVKEHKEYRGIKQTILTRCKIVSVELEEKEHRADTNDVEKVIDNFLAVVNS